MSARCTLVVVAATFSALHPGVSRGSTDPDVARHEITDFLRYLASVAPKSSSEYRSDSVNSSRMASFVSSAGLLITNVNDPDLHLEVPRDQLKRELGDSRGVVFPYLALLAYDVRVLDQNAIQLKKLGETSWSVPIADKSVLTFRRE